MNSHDRYETVFGSIGNRRQVRRFPSMQQQDSTASLQSQQDVIIYDEEFVRQEDHNRAIRRRRLIIRPAVVLVLGFFVFRINDYYSYDTGNIRIFFGSLLGGNRRNTNAYRNNQGPGLRKPFGADQELYGNSINEHSDSGLWLPAPPVFSLSGNPSASVYSMVTDMNDDDSNDDVSSGIDKHSSPNKTTEGNLHHTDPAHQPPARDSSESDNENKNAKPDQKNNNRNKNRNNSKNHNQNNSKNSIPSSYGWVPDTYPDPWIDPVSCGTAYLAAEQFQQQQEQQQLQQQQQQQQQQQLDHRSYDTDDDYLLFADTAASKGAAFRGPRLCDPDWVLGGAALERIAHKMKEFSDRFDVRDLVAEVAPDVASEQPESPRQRVELAVATVRKVSREL